MTKSGEEIQDIHKACSELAKSETNSFFGFGRLNANDAVKANIAGEIFGRCVDANFNTVEDPYDLPNLRNEGLISR